MFEWCVAAESLKALLGVPDDDVGVRAGGERALAAGRGRIASRGWWRSNSTNRLEGQPAGPRRRSVYSMCRRFSIPGPPLGRIFESVAPASPFCSGQLNGAVVGRDVPRATSARERSPEMLLIRLGLSGAVCTRTSRPPNPGASSACLVDEEVLRAGLARDLPAVS